MVNKVDLSASIQAQGVNLLLQELLGEYPMQVFAALAEMGQADLSLPSKIATELLSKNFITEQPKLERLVTLLPFFKDLSHEIVKKMEAGGKPDFSQDPDNKEFQSSQAGSIKGVEKPVSEKDRLAEIASQTRPLEKTTNEKEEIYRQQMSNLTRPISEPKPIAGPVMMSTIKEVLSVLAYFANPANLLKPDSLELVEKVVRPMIDQLVQPVQKPAEGEMGSKHREPLRYKEVEKSPSRGRALPFPADLSNQSEKNLSTHKIDRTNPESDARSNKQETPSLKQNLPNLPEAKPMLAPAPVERTAISAAPFSFQHPISTAPRRAKKKPKDAWEEAKENLEDEEDPFQK